MYVIYYSLSILEICIKTTANVTLYYSFERALWLNIFNRQFFLFFFFLFFFQALITSIYIMGNKHS